MQLIFYIYQGRTIKDGSYLSELRVHQCQPFKTDPLNEHHGED